MGEEFVFNAYKKWGILIILFPELERGGKGELLPKTGTLVRICKMVTRFPLFNFLPKSTFVTCLIEEDNRKEQFTTIITTVLRKTPSKDINTNL